ncbi:MAG TPA: ElyC/SanA/YdcF family protein [Trichocoleus sp.]|jgi:hydroxymethylpyrimidine pyrophosphatase-like HAD family hydrolase/uncharacterized SAM-binding protein YcdF (DUF218 family)
MNYLNRNELNDNLSTAQLGQEGNEDGCDRLRETDIFSDSFLTNCSEVTKKRLLMLRELGIDLIAFDYDGTLFGDGKTHVDAAKLLVKVIKAGINVAVVTGRDATVRRALVPEFIQQCNGRNLSFFLATSNGVNVYRVDSTGAHCLLNNPIRFEDIKRVVAAYRRLNIIGSKLRILEHLNLASQKWEGLLKREFILISRRNPGVWVEPSKISLAFPLSFTDRKKAIKALEAELGGEFALTFGSDVVDVIPQLCMEPKRYALDFILDHTGGSLLSTVSFGDTPLGNDRGLIEIPFGFTNDITINVASQPPFVLGCGSNSPVQVIYDATELMLSLSHSIKPFSKAIVHHASRIWDYMVERQDLESVDAILGLGSFDQGVAAHAARLWLAGWAKYIVFSGGVAHLKDLAKTPWSAEEATIFAEVAVGMGVPEECILQEKLATNTGENFRFTEDLLRTKGLNFNSLLVVCKPYMGKRARATGEYHWPNKKLVFSSEDISFQDYLVASHSPQAVMHTMVGDLQRLKLYGERGLQIPVSVPEPVEESFHFLVDAGFDKHLVK